MGMGVPERTLSTSSGNSISATSTVLVSLPVDGTERCASEVGMGGTGGAEPLSLRRIDFLKIEDLIELDEGLISSPANPIDASRSVDLFFSLAKALLPVES